MRWSRPPRTSPDLVGAQVLCTALSQILEPFHGEEYQAHQLRKLLKLPGRGRYENARIFAGVARQLDLSLQDLAAALWRSGGPHKYWRVGTTVDDKSEWERMRAGGFAAVGWEAIGDLSDISADQAGKQVLRERIERHYPGEASTVTKAANQIFHFLTLAQEGDVILAMEGAASAVWGGSQVRILSRRGTALVHIAVESSGSAPMNGGSRTSRACARRSCRSRRT